MNRLFKGLALFVAIACLVWVAVLWRWQATARDMTTQDIVVYLGLLPVTVFALVLLVAWAGRGVAERQAKASAGAPAPAAAGVPSPAAAGVPSPGVDEAERHGTVQLLAAHIATAPARSVADLAGAARDGAPRPGLDPELRDEDGLPVLAARIADVDASAGALAEEAEAQIAALRVQHSEWAGADIGAPVWRALSALREPLAGAVQSLAPWAETLAPQPGPQADAAAAPTVRVLLGWPAEWSAFEQEVARVVAADWVAQEGAGVLPGARLAISAQAVGGEALLLQADRLMQTLARAQHDEPLIVAACHSAIGAEAVAALERAGRLYHAGRRPKGQMPAEAAAALVLAGARWPDDGDGDGDSAVPHLHRPALFMREKSIDAPGRVGPQTALQAVQSALGASRLGAASVAGLVGDADQHTERAAEFFVAGAEALPHLDAGEDLCAIGHVTGAVGGVAALLVVACAAARATAAQAPCMALVLGDAHARLALVALPGAPPAAAAAPGSPA